MNTETIITTANCLSSWVTDILAPIEVLRECNALAAKNEAVREVRIGQTESGHCLKAYEFGCGQPHTLFYGFPDPGEAVGGTTILALLRGLTEKNKFLGSLKIGWHFIPCLNLDDQPDGGASLTSIFRNPNIREVDWCTDNPRSETTALLGYAESIRPTFTYSLHDEYHSGESIPVCMGVSEPLERSVCQRARTCLSTFGLQIKKNPHETMGDAFTVMTQFGDDYLKSTFLRLARYGLVGTCEVSQQKGLSPSKLVSAQIAIGMVLLDVTMKNRTKSIKQGVEGDTLNRAPQL